MNAYNADMEIPADIEWPELDGHHGILAVDATVLAAVERVLSVSFDPFGYGTDTNPVANEFLAELLHDTDPTAAEAAALIERG
eukprot:jgi/Tetstr1/420758/TSEL_011835.t1